MRRSMCSRPRAMWWACHRFHRRFVDFAFTDPSEVGKSLPGVRINDPLLCPLGHTVAELDFVQVITTKTPPEPRLAQFRGHTDGANRIRQWYKRSHPTKTSAGRDSLERETGRNGWLMPAQGEAIAKVAAPLQNLGGTEDLPLHSLRGVTCIRCSTRLREEDRLASEAAAPVLSKRGSGPLEVSGQSRPKTLATRHQRQRDPLALRSDYRLRRVCCCPLPGERSWARALATMASQFHRQDCAKRQQNPVWKAPPARALDPTPTPAPPLPVQLRIEGARPGRVLKDILTRLSDSRSNGSDARVRTHLRTRLRRPQGELLEVAGNCATTSTRSAPMATCSTSAAPAIRLKGRAASYAVMPSNPC